MADERVSRLSKRSVDLSSPEPKRFTLWDTELKGFGLVVQPSGVKSYIVRYRIGGGRSGTLKQMVLGRHGALTPDEARTLGRKALAAVAHGQDPAGVRAQARGAVTVSDVADCPSSDDLRQGAGFRNGGSGSSGFEVRPLGRDAASGGGPASVV